MVAVGVSAPADCGRQTIPENKEIISNFSQIFLQGLASCNVVLFFCELLEKLHRPDMVDIAKLCKALIELKKMEWFDPLIWGLIYQSAIRVPVGIGTRR